MIWLFHRNINVTPAKPWAVFSMPPCSWRYWDARSGASWRDGTTQPTLQASPPLSLDSRPQLTYCWISEVVASGFFPRIALPRGSRTPFWRQIQANCHTLARGEWRCHPAWYWERSGGVNMSCSSAHPPALSLSFGGREKGMYAKHTSLYCYTLYPPNLFQTLQGPSSLFILIQNHPVTAVSSFFPLPSFPGSLSLLSLFTMPWVWVWFQGCTQWKVRSSFCNLSSDVHTILPTIHTI